MKKVWIYSITYYTIDDEYGHRIWCGTDTEVFPSEESAKRFKEDWEEFENLKSLTYLDNWDYSYESYIIEKKF